MVETPHRHKNHGSLFNVSIDISIPGAELAVNKEGNEDIFVAIRDAFEAARRQIIQHFQKRKAKQPRHHKAVDAAITSDRGSSDAIIDDYNISENFLDDFSLNDPTLGRSATSFG